MAAEKLNEFSFTRALFGGEIEIVVYDYKKINLDKLLEEVYSEALRLQKIFNFYDEGSELSKLNAKRKMVVSYELLEVLSKSLAISKLTHGEYTPTFGKEALQRKQGKLVTKTNSSYNDVSISNSLVTLKNPEMLIDLGSIAKGYITDRLAEFLKIKGVTEFLIDSRGDILVSGEIQHLISVQHPRDAKKNVCTVSLSNEGIATSGDYNQFHNDFEHSHIINAKDVISVSVVAPTLEEADVYATALFVSTESDRKNMMQDNPAVKSLVITKNLKQKFYNNFEELIHGSKS
jgi:FAD:protein FMN transferase